MHDIESSLKDTWIALKNLFNNLFLTYPWLYLFLALLILYIFKLFSISEGFTNIIIGLMIVIMSLIIYSYGTSYAETTLSLILALIALFSLSWQDNNHAILFGILFFIYTLLTIVVKSIKLGMSYESILTKASLNYYHSKSYKNIYSNNKDIYKKLDRLIKKESTKINYLSPINKATIAEYLSLRNYNIDHLIDAFNLIEIIKIVFQLDIKESIKFYYSLYLINTLPCRNFNSNLIEKQLDLLVTIPLDFNELYYLLNKFKKDIINNKFEILNLINMIEIYALKGFNSDDIYNAIHNTLE